MKHFWTGFRSEKTAAPVRLKKHVIVLYWDPKAPKSVEAKSGIRRISLKYPSVSVKVVNGSKDPTKPLRHNVRAFPTMLLLKDGREVDRISDIDGDSLIEQLFRKANR